MARELGDTIRFLGVTLGERHPARPWQYADAADYLANRLQDMGYALDRQGYVTEGGAGVTQNLVVQIPGGVRGNEWIVVGANYDSPAGSPGIEDNAAGVAALLFLAESLRPVRFERSLRLAFLSGGELPTVATEDAGGRHLLLRAAEAGADPSVFVELRRLAFLTQGDPPLERQSACLDLFAAQASSDAAARWAASLAGSLGAPCPVRLLEPTEAPTSASPYWAAGAPALSLGVVARGGDAGRAPASAVSDVDLLRTARLVIALESALLQLAGGSATSSAP